MDKKVTYFNLPITSPYTPALLKMDSQISDKIHVTVTNILNTSDNIDSLTELQVRHLASKTLNIDLDSRLSYKILVRQIIESFLLSNDNNFSTSNVNVDAACLNGAVLNPVDEVEVKPLVQPHTCLLIKLSQKREVAVRSNGGKTVVTIGELPVNDESSNANATPKGISLSPDQWSIFRKSFPIIEEAIAKVESKLRSDINNKQGGDKQHSSANRSKQNGVEPLIKDGAHHRTRLVASREPTGTSTLASTSQRLVPMEIIRFDGKNYQQWVDRMESYLNKLKVAYVLSEPCPSAVGVVDRELSQTLLAAEKWMDDDHICHQNILNSLCDNLYRLYVKKSGTAKDVWEELKLVYLHEEHGAKVSLVKKYIEFQINEEKSVFDQVHELNQIADALIASGMYVEEKFHVNAIISKLPPSWKPCSIRLMMEDYLPVWMLMNHLKAEEESCLKGNNGETLISRVDSPVTQPSKTFKPLGPHRMSMKKPGVSHSYHEAERDKKFKFCDICKKKGHNPEQCWFRTSGVKDTTNEKDKLPSENTVSGNGVVDSKP